VATRRAGRPRVPRARGRPCDAYPARPRSAPAWGLAAVACSTRHDERPAASRAVPRPPGPPGWAALARELAGEAPVDARDAAEAAAARAWLAAHPGDAALLDAVGAVARLVPPAGDDVAAHPVDTEAALARVRARIADAEGRAGEARAAGAPTLHVARGTPAARPTAGGAARDDGRRARRLVPLAAAATLLLAAGVAVWSRDARVDGGDAAGARVAAAPARAVTAPVGRPDSLVLADGSRVVLAPGSTLEIAAGYGAERRELTLRGVAHFVVRHDAARPFVVRAGAARVRDVGTAFVVRSDAGADGRTVAVSVTEGVVALAPADAAGGATRGAAPGASDAAAAAAEHELRAGDRGTLAPDGAVRVARGGATPDDVAWMQGRLVYRAAPIAEVRADLRRWYGVELQLADPALAGRHLTLTIADEPVDEVLRAIALALGATLERRGDTAVVRPARGAASGVRRAPPPLPAPLPVARRDGGRVARPGTRARARRRGDARRRDADRGGRAGGVTRGRTRHDARTRAAPGACVAEPALVPAAPRRWPAPLDRAVALDARGLPLAEALDRLQAAARVRLTYSPEALPRARVACVARARATVGDLLAELLRGAPLAPVVAGDDHVVLAPAQPAVVGDSAPAFAARPGVLERVVVTGSAMGAALGAPERALPVALSVARGADVAARAGGAGHARPGARRRRARRVGVGAGADVARHRVGERARRELVRRDGAEDLRRRDRAGQPAPPHAPRPGERRARGDDPRPAGRRALRRRRDQRRGERAHAPRRRGRGRRRRLAAPDQPCRHVAQRLHQERRPPGTPPLLAAGGVLAQEHALAVRAGRGTRTAALGVTLGTLGAYLPGASSRTLLVTGSGRVVGRRSIVTGTLRVADDAVGAVVNPLLAGAAPAARHGARHAARRPRHVARPRRRRRHRAAGAAPVHARHLGDARPPRGGGRTPSSRGSTATAWTARR
jgi:ferric-dicitrate binding protein FerR (iron transport regulator)